MTYAMSCNDLYIHKCVGESKTKPVCVCVCGIMFASIVEIFT